MKRAGLGLFCLLLAFIIFSGSSLASHQINHFQGNKKGAVSITFDDGYPSQVTNGVPLLNARKLRGTFFLVTHPTWIDSHVLWEGWSNVVSQGHELGSTTVNHPDLTTLSETNMRWELDESQRMIDENIPSQFTLQDVMLAVNCGGPEYSNQSGVVYQADESFSGGETRTIKATIRGTEDGFLYQSERYGNFSYSIPLTNGNYTVTLQFAEITYNSPGWRVLNVFIEDVEVVSHLDLFTQSGKKQGL